MPKNGKRKIHPHLRDKNDNVKIKKPSNASQSLRRDGGDSSDNSNHAVDELVGSTNFPKSPEKSRKSMDIEIIDGQIPGREEVQDTNPSDDNNYEKMNDNHHTYAIKEADRNIHKLFDHISYSEDAVSSLPNRSWAIHRTELPVKRIVICEMIMHNINGTGLEPFYAKQIVFDEKLNFEVFFLMSRTVLKDKPSVIQSMEDYESLLDHVHSLKLCTGGPDTQLYSNITPECAYKDPTNKWRHNLCTLEVNDCDTCENCLLLADILKRHSQRVKPLKQKNAIGIPRRKRPGQSKDT